MAGKKKSTKLSGVYRVLKGISFGDEISHAPGEEVDLSARKWDIKFLLEDGAIERVEEEVSNGNGKE